LRGLRSVVHGEAVSQSGAHIAFRVPARGCGLAGYDDCS
jgi:hypothetical protein